MSIETLLQVLEEMPVDRIILGQQLYNYLLERDGSCPLTPEEITDVLNEDAQCFE